jgi:hypothetical protein
MAPGHCGEFNASFQPANATSNLTWGFAPGYNIAGLQPGTLHTTTIAAYPFSGRAVLCIDDEPVGTQI